MVNVECTGCGAPYSVSEKRIPAKGLNMRCPKCGTSFLVEKPGGGGAPPSAPRRQVGTALGHAPPPRRQPPQPKGPPRPPPSKKPLFGDGGDEEFSVDGLMRAADKGRGSTSLGAAGAAAGGFGVLDMGLPGEGGGDVDQGWGADLPARSDHADLPMPSGGPHEAPPFDIDMDLGGGGGQAPPFDVDLPMPAGGHEAPPFDVDLPMAGGRHEAPPFDVDLPMPSGAADFPSPVDADLPMAAPQGHLPSPAEAGLPMPAEAGLPMPHDAGLPMPAEAGLPMPADAGLPMPHHAGLPMPADAGLPMPADAGLPLPADEGLPMPAGYGDLPLPTDGELPLPAAHGDLPLPSDQDFPLPAGDGDLPLPAAGGDLPLPNDYNLPVGGSADNTIPLEGGEAMQFALDGQDMGGEFSGDLSNAQLESQPPRPMSDGDFGVGGEFGLEEGGGEEIIEGEAPQQKIKKKRISTLRVLIAAVPLLAIAGGLLSLTPLGPYGIYAIKDALSADDYASTLSNFRGVASTELDNDTAATASALLQQAQTQQAEMPRYVPMKAYTAFLAFMTCVRFGNDSQRMAVGRQLLAEIPAENQEPLVQLARAASVAAEGQLDAAKAQAGSVVLTLPGDVDALALQAEIALAKEDRKEAIALWTAAVKAHKSARTQYGLARAHFLNRELPKTLETAEAVLKASKDHAGARTLIAHVRFLSSRKDEKVVELLEAVTGKGPVRQAASRSELVIAYSLLGDVYLARSKMTKAEQVYAEALKLDPKSERALVGNGELFFAAGRYSEALARFEAASRVKADSISALVGKSKTKIALERAKEAKAELAKREKSSKHPLVGYWLGKSMEALGERDEAEGVYRRAIKKGVGHPDVVYPYVALAAVLSARGEEEEAGKVLAEASEKLPDNAKLHLAKGEVALASGRVDIAKGELQKALELEPDNSQARFKLAQAHRKGGEFEAAQQQLDLVIKADPEFPGLALEQGVLFERMGQNEKALQMYNDALKKAPNDIDLKLRVGSTQVISGYPKQAIPMLREVLNKRPQSAEVNHFLGRALLLVGQPPQEALRYLQQATQYDPNRAVYHLYVAWAANEAGQPSIAEKAIDKALALDKLMGDAYWQRGILLQKRGQTLDALEELQKALELNPTRHEAYATMARCYQDQSDYTKAEEAWRKAIEGTDLHPEWHFRLGNILVDKGDKEGAGEYLRKAVDLAEARGSKPGWLWKANFLLGESLRGSDKARAIKAYKAFLQLSTSENAYRAEAERALEALEGN